MMHKRCFLKNTAYLDHTLNVITAGISVRFIGLCNDSLSIFNHIDYYHASLRAADLNCSVEILLVTLKVFKTIDLVNISFFHTTKYW